MGFLDGLGRKVEGIPEHPFQFGPFTVMDVAWFGLQLLQKMILTSQDFVFCDAYRSCHNDCSVISSAKVEKPVVTSKHFWVKTLSLST